MILGKFSLVQAKSWSREFEKILNFFLLTPYVLYYFQKVKKIFVEHHWTWKFISFPTVFLKMSYLFFSPRYRDSKSAVIFNRAHKHRAHNVPGESFGSESILSYYELFPAILKSMSIPFQGLQIESEASF